ncbi:hypothetical protein Droror1_Dr00022294 [Drosera rotundifolia]
MPYVFLFLGESQLRSAIKICFLNLNSLLLSFFLFMPGGNLIKYSCSIVTMVGIDLKSQQGSSEAIHLLCLKKSMKVLMVSIRNGPEFDVPMWVVWVHKNEYRIQRSLGHAKGART